MNNEHIEQLIRAELARRELARRSFKDYIHYVNPSYQMKWFHNVISEKLELILEKKIKKLAIFVPPQHGKLLSINELCLTTKGWKKHGDLQEGDYVFGHDGKPKKVLANSGAYEWDIVLITFSNGLQIEASPEHEWVLENSHGDTIICESRDLTTHKDYFIKRTVFGPSVFYVKSVTANGSKIGNCIQVEGGMYLAGPDLIPTHNSELASKLFPSFVIGKKPETKIALCSYSAELSEKINADVQGYISSEEYTQIFDHIRVPIKGEGSKSTGRLDIMRRSEVRLTKWKKSGGYVIARGVGGGTTGMTVDLLIIDDPVKDLEDANSVNIRDKAWEWYVAVGQTRIDNDASQILIQTRWHQDDLSGRILSKHGIYSESNPNGWVVVSLPGLKTEDHNDYDPRSVGEALWPEKHSAEKLLGIKSDDVRIFDALIQQDPKPNSDALVYPDWKEIAEFPKEEDLDSVFYGLDFGFTNDPTALVKIGKSGRNIYLDEIIYEKGLGPHALRKKMVALGVSRLREIYADHEPAIIHDLKYPKTETGMDLVGEAFHILKAEKAIFAGISTVKEYRVFYTARSVNIKHEKNNYAWKYVGGMNTNEPIDRDNHCFTGDTLITTIDGQKRIDRIVEGDLVLTSDGWRPVTRLFKNGLKAVRVTKLKFSTHETIIKGTPDHKIKTTLGWMDLRDIRRGDALFSPTGVRGQLFTSEIRLQDVQVLDEYEALVYDIEVDDMHEYFANGVLVHNCMDAIRYGIHTKYRFRGLYYGPSITYS